MGAEHVNLVAATSPAFQALHADIHAAVLRCFPDARPVVAFGMAAFQVPLPDPPAADTWIGTQPRTHLTVAPTEKKAGITVHVWHPNRPSLLADNAAWLKEAGFKPMVGCLQWNRKAPFPMDAFEKLLHAAKAAM